MTTETSLHSKLNKLQAAMKVPKKQQGRFGAYRSAEGILEVAMPLITKEGLTLLLSDSIECVGERNYVKSTATLMDGETEVEATAYAWEGEVNRGLDASQITGATSSYARKYALNGLFAINDTKDADSYTDPPADPKKPAAPAAPAAKTYIADWQVKLLLSKARDYSGLADKAAVIQWFTEKTGVEPNKVKRLDFAKMQKLLEEERDV